jgi:branched-chain amino acid transport system permease protein
MSAPPSFEVERWTTASLSSVVAVALMIAVLALGPSYLSDNAIDKLTTLFVYVVLATMWNALAGYAGLVSIGQQAFFGLGAYFAVRLADGAIPVYVALASAAALTAIVSWPLSYFMLRLRDGEFAIGMWVVAELFHLLVNLDPLIQGETGTSLVELNSYGAAARHAYTYWMALGGMSFSLLLLFALLRSRTGAGIQAIRDNEEAASSVGVAVAQTKRLIFVLAALGAGLAGALWLANAITFQPKTYFSAQWTAYMIFMALVGGLGTFEGALIGAVIFFAIEALFGAAGVWYLIGLGATALGFALFLPRGLWGWVEARFGLSLLPVGYRLRLKRASSSPAETSRLGAQQPRRK